MKTKVLVVGGGETFTGYKKYLSFLCSIKLNFNKPDTKGWKANLQEDLGDEYEVIHISMPNKLNAKYAEWQIWFQKYLSLIDKNTMIVGHSLGGTFLLKYLHNKKKEFNTLFIVAGADMKGDFSLPKHLYIRSLRPVYFYHSMDDKIVPIKDLTKLTKRLSTANCLALCDRGHFLVEHFPEIVHDIKTLTR